jgi:hypothetical protein
MRRRKNVGPKKDESQGNGENYKIKITIKQAYIPYI